MGSFVIAAGAASPSGITATRYFPCPGHSHLGTATEADVQTLIRDTYTLGAFFVRVYSNGRNGDSTGRSRVNTANGAHSVSIPASTSGAFEDTANTNSLVTTDLLAAVIEITGSSGSVLISGIAFVLTASTNSTILAGSGATANNVSAGQTSDFYIAGVNSGSTTEANSQVTIRNTLTLAFMRIYVSTNTINTGTTTYKSRIDGADGSQSLSIGFGATGSFEDTTNSDVIANGSKLTYRIVTSGASGALGYNATHMRCVGSAPLMAASQETTEVFLGDAYQPIHGNIDDGNFDANTRITLRTAVRVNQLFVRVTAHGVTAGVTVYARQNGASTALSVVIAQSTTGTFETTSTTLDYVAADSVNYFIDHGGGGGSISISIIAAGVAVQPVVYGILVDWNGDGDFADDNESITTRVLSARWRRGRDAES